MVRRAKDGDRKALAALCERHAPRVERLAAHVLSDPEDARDAAQEALAKLCVRLGQFRGEAQFSTWLHRLVVNTCRDVARASGPVAASRCWRTGGSQPTPTPYGALALSELRAELGAAAGLDLGAQARVVVLKDAFD